MSAPAAAAADAPDQEHQASAQPAGANTAPAAPAEDIQKDILAALRDLKTAVQASNTRRDLGAGQKTETVEDILSSILNNGEVK